MGPEVFNLLPLLPKLYCSQLNATSSYYRSDVLGFGWFIQAPLLRGRRVGWTTEEDHSQNLIGQFPQAGGTQLFHTHLGQVTSTPNVWSLKSAPSLGWLPSTTNLQFMCWFYEPFISFFVKSNTAQRNPCNTHSFKAHQWPTSGWYHFFLLPCSIVLPCPTPRKMRQSFPACHSRSKEQWRLWKAKCRLFREKWQNWKIFMEWMVHEWSHYTTHDLTDWTHTFLGGLPFPDPHFPSLTKAFGKSCIFD